jgi:RHS repeat-associated protein
VHTIVNGQPVTQEYNLGYDAENRVVSVTGVNGTNYSASFTYDGNGQRVKSVINGEKILFDGGFELNATTSQVTKYYPGGAIRKYTIPQSMNVEYTLGDHLGSASVMTDSSGNKVSEMRYTPWGQVRYSWVDPNLSTTPAYTLPKHTFTGQYSYMDDPSTQGFEGFGLMFYNARFYDPQVGHFSQPDTFIPNELQGLDRYAYVGNNPVSYTDPSGHIRQRHLKDCQWEKTGWCSGAITAMEAANGIEYWINKIETEFPNVTILTPFTVEQLIDIFNALCAVRSKFGSQGAFAHAFGEINIAWKSFEDMPLDEHGQHAVGYYDTGNNTIYLSDKAFENGQGVWSVVHELGHQFDMKDACSGLWGCDPKKYKSQSLVTHFKIGCKVTDLGCDDWDDIGATDYGKTNSVEDFADSFAVAVLYGTEFYGVDRFRVCLINAWILMEIREYSPTGAHRGR